MSCGCNRFNEIASGGLSCGGISDVAVIKIEGGVTCGGSALVDVLQDTYDGMTALWGLSEAPSADTDNYKDRTRKALHGTGGNGNADYVPDTQAGVFCLNGALFDGEVRDFITLPPDDLSQDHAFTVSCWTRIDTFFAQRMLFSRGHDNGTEDRWAFALGYSFINNLVGSVNTLVDGQPVEVAAYSTQMLAQDKLYHVACSYDGSGEIKLYVNGAPDGSATTSGENIPQTNGGRHGSWNQGAYHTGLLQEVRVYPEVKSEAWLTAERDNFCDGGFFIVGEEEVLALGGLVASGEAVIA